MMTPKLSRELSALQLSPTLTSRRGRTRSASESQTSNSDTENEAPNPNLKKDSNIEMAEEQSAILNNQRKMLKNPHFLRSKEAKIQKAHNLNLPLNFVASTTPGASPTTVMSLRPRPQINTATPSPMVNRKRKPELSTLIGNCSTPPPVSKSPRIVTMSKPVMTRSRNARVVQLKK